MIQTIEGIYRDGKVEPLGILPLVNNARCVVVFQPTQREVWHSEKATAVKASRGSMKGQLSTVEGFMARKAEEKALEA